MSLLERVATEFDADEAKALAGLAPFFMVIRLSIDREAFGHVRACVPDAEEWAKLAARGDAGRTGELLALITPQSLVPRLHQAGYSDSEVERLAGTIERFLGEHVPEDVMSTLTTKVPALGVKK